MDFSLLEGFHKKWRDILVIGKTIEQSSKKYHIIGMTLSDEAKLYILEPYIEPENRRRKGVRNQRRLLKEQQETECRYLHCNDFYLGSERLQVQGGSGAPLWYSYQDYGAIQLFFDMMGAGWTVPEWLKHMDWGSLQLVTLDVAPMENGLPAYSPGMPITITHGPGSIQHILEKPVTLQVGQSRSFSFMDHDGDQTWCHINNVTLIDVWKATEEQLSDPRLAERLSPEQLQETRNHSYDALGQSCPKGMCYVGIEYECSKDFSLSFHSRQYLASRPETHGASACFFLMRLKPDKETGTHGLALKGCVVDDMPVPPDTSRIPAELFLYYEKINAWTETV